MKKKNTFESALESLEQIVEKMESGGLSLEQSLKLYEEGMELSRYCVKRLENAQMRVETITQSADGLLRAEAGQSDETQAPLLAGAESGEPADH